MQFSEIAANIHRLNATSLIISRKIENFSYQLLSLKIKFLASKMILIEASTLCDVNESHFLKISHNLKAINLISGCSNNNRIFCHRYSAF